MTRPRASILCIVRREGRENRSLPRREGSGIESAIPDGNVSSLQESSPPARHTGKIYLDAATREAYVTFFFSLLATPIGFGIVMGRTNKDRTALLAGLEEDFSSTGAMVLRVDRCAADFGGLVASLAAWLDVPAPVESMGVGVMRLHALLAERRTPVVLIIDDVGTLPTDLLAQFPHLLPPPAGTASLRIVVGGPLDLPEHLATARLTASAGVPIIARCTLDRATGDEPEPTAAVDAAEFTVGVDVAGAEGPLVLSLSPTADDRPPSRFGWPRRGLRVILASAAAACFMLSIAAGIGIVRQPAPPPAAGAVPIIGAIPNRLAAASATSNDSASTPSAPAAFEPPDGERLSPGIRPPPPAGGSPSPIALPVPRTPVEASTDRKSRGLIPESTTERVRTAPRPSVPDPAQATEIDALLRRGDELLAARDISAARRMFEHAATASGGAAAAALQAGKTYDPNFLAEIGARKIPAQPARAIYWYTRALEHGSVEARERMDRLGSGL
jgi:hypothetical protein